MFRCRVLGMAARSGSISFEVLNSEGVMPVDLLTRCNKKDAYSDPGSISSHTKTAGAKRPSIRTRRGCPVWGRNYENLMLSLLLSKMNNSREIPI